MYIQKESSGLIKITIRILPLIIIMRLMYKFLHHDIIFINLKTSLQNHTQTNLNTEHPIL